LARRITHCESRSTPAKTSTAGNKDLAAHYLSIG